MRIETENKLDFDDVLIRPKRSTLNSREDVSLERTFRFRNSSKTWKGVPIIASNMDGVGTFEMAEYLSNEGLVTCLVKHYLKHELRLWIESTGSKIPDNWIYSLGINDADLSKFDAVVSGIDPGLVGYVCIDVANGYSERFVHFVRDFRNLYPDIVIIAGNVVTGEMTEELILNGADIVKVGIGPGSVCTTRIKTGVGYPQLSAIIECADAAHGLGGHIIADGGCTSPGDIAKAFGAGADFVMLGGMLAGHDEGGGERVNKIFETNELDNKGQRINRVENHVRFYGMSSHAANEKHSGGLKNYRASEGREVLIPYRGPISVTIRDILGGLRSACTYVGAGELRELSKRTTFVKVNNTHNRVYEKTTTRT